MKISSPSFFYVKYLYYFSYIKLKQDTMNKRMVFLEMIIAQGQRDECPAGEVEKVEIDLIQSKLDEAPDNEKTIRNTIKAALENMYIFGGMPKPDPRYDQYLAWLTEIIMKEVQK